MRGKRAQFFLLAAVIISAVIISLGAGTNRADVNDEPSDFYDSGYEARREVGAFLDYSVFSGFDTDEDLTEFLDLLAENMEERNPGVDFVFIYGKGSSMTVKNHGANSIYVDGVKFEGSRQTRSSIHIDGVFEKVIPGDSEVVEEIISVGDNFSVGVGEGNGGKLFFTSDYMQVIIITQKNEKGDIYVDFG